MTRSTMHRAGALGTALLLSIVLGACDGLGLGGEPDTFRVNVEAVNSGDLVLVISDRFRFEPDPTCDPEAQQCPEVLRLLSADTATITAPETRNYPFTETLRYLVEVYPAEVANTVTLRAFVDGDLWANETRELAIPASPDEERETIQFVYQYSEPRIN